MLGSGGTSHASRPLRVGLAALLAAAALLPGLPALAAPDDDEPPAETTPVETTPAETTPAETTPAATTPAETAADAELRTAAAAAPCKVARTLRRLDVGSDVICLERALVQRGFRVRSPLRGSFDRSTVAAVRQIQRQRGILATGVAGPATLRVLGIWSGPRLDAPCTVDKVIRRRSTGLAARCVEQRLIRLGYEVTGPDRYFDKSAATAVAAYQRREGFRIVNGVAGPWVLQHLRLWSGPSLRMACTVSRPVLVGTTGMPARCLEQRLIKFGYPLAAPDWSFDDASAVYLRKYQRHIGVAPDSRAGKLVLSSLRIWKQPPRVTCKVTTTVRAGSSGDAAKCVERRLVALGYALYGPDGTFDGTSVDAVRAYQQAKGLTVDGVAGPFTLYALKIWGGRNPHAPPPLPANSGTGRRVVYSRAMQRVWAVDEAGRVVKTHLVSGRLHEPYAGTYSVFSRSEHTYNVDDPDVKWHWMVRFAHGPEGGNIGFHEIPTRFGVPLQSESQLGQPLSGGCVRQSTADALWMWNWAYLGTKVVVL
jgi:peptidoglycan hydrolase-like protein with peptidoglycan-binding domain